MTLHDRLVRRIRSGRASGAEQGIALITVLLMMAALAALTTTVAVVAIDNTQNAHADRQGTAALGISEAGVAQALAYIRKTGVGELTGCVPIRQCATPWGNKLTPQSVAVPGFNSVYKVWIEELVALPVTAAIVAGSVSAPVGTYRVHSQGTNGSNPGTRNVTVDVDVTPFEFPIGVFAHTIAGGGASKISNTSVFSDGCIEDRDKLLTVSPDAYLGIPAAAYSTKTIFDKKGNCATGAGIHDKGTNVCSTAYPRDQDSQGAYNPAAYPAGPAQTPPAATRWANWQASSCAGLPTPATGSFIDAELMKTKFSFPATQLDAAYYDSLKSSAVEQNFYRLNDSAIPAPLQLADAYLTYPHPVLYYEFTGSPGTVDLKDLKGYERAMPIAAGSSSCNKASAVVVVRNGDVVFNGNTNLAANVFVPEGSYRHNGTADLVGTIYANEVHMIGGGKVTLDQCFLANLPGSLLAITSRDFVEADR